MSEGGFNDLTRRFAKAYRSIAEGWRSYWDALVDFLALPQTREKHGIADPEALKRYNYEITRLVEALETAAKRAEKQK